MWPPMECIAASAWLLGCATLPCLEGVVMGCI